MRARLLASVVVLVLVVGAFAWMPAHALAEVGDLLFASSTAGGAASTAHNDDPVISANGRYVAFTSSSANFPGWNGQLQVYRKDLSTGAIVLASSTTAGAAGDSFSGYPSISDDGRYVAFESYASNFGGSGGQVYRKDLSTGTLILVSKTAAGIQGDYGSLEASMSASGRYVAFRSWAPNFPGSNGRYQVYRKDLSGGALVLASSTAAGAAGDYDSSRPSISPDGRYVAFLSGASNFPGYNAVNQVYRKDLSGGALVLASTTAAGVRGSSSSDYPSICSGGRYVVFFTSSDNFPGHNTFPQVYRKDLGSGALEMASSTVRPRKDARPGRWCRTRTEHRWT